MPHEHFLIQHWFSKRDAGFSEKEISSKSHYSLLETPLKDLPYRLLADGVNLTEILSKCDRRRSPGTEESAFPGGDSICIRTYYPRTLFGGACPKPFRQTLQPYGKLIRREIS
ncbi:hypothetical protein MRX96_016326 [Rhipicephalus microplus]